MLLADVGAFEDAQAFGVGGHDAVLDAVVDHFDEVARAVGAAVEIALLGSAAELLAAGGARDVAGAGGESGEDGIEVFHDIVFAADHHAVAAFETPHAAAGADVDVVNLLRGEVFGAADVVDVVGVAAVDEDVARLQQRQRGRRWICRRPPRGP